MTTLLVWSHFYSSVPPELTGSRGGQTFAHSKELAPLIDQVKSGCYYEIDDRVNDGGVDSIDLPVCWGWYPLNEEFACVHRIGDAGTDDRGRPGNFLCHNLIVRHDDLATIDYDVPSLITWVRRNSPIQFPRPEGNEGFARRFKQVCEQMELPYREGQDFSAGDRAQLKSFPAMQVPTAEIIRLRRETDAAWRQELWWPLERKLKSAGVWGLLRAILCPTEEARPVVITGIEGPQRESADEFRLINLLFTWLPAHCRRHLTFSTYSYAELIKPVGGPSHAARELYILNRYSKPERIESLRDQVRHVDLVTGKVVPEATASAAFQAVHGWASDPAQDREFVDWRNFAGHFNYPAVAAGVATATTLYGALTDGECSEAEVVALKHSTEVQRRYCPPLFGIVCALGGVPTTASGGKALRQRADAAILAALHRQNGFSSSEPPTAEIRQTLLDLLGRALSEWWLDLVEQVVRLANESTWFEENRVTLLTSIAQTIQAQKIESEITQLLEFWRAVANGCVTRHSAAKTFLNDVAGNLCRVLIQAVQRGTTLQGDLDVNVLELLEAMPIDEEQHLVTMLSLLAQLREQLPEGAGVERNGEFLCKRFAAESQPLSPLLVKQTCQHRPPTMLRFFPEWRYVANRNPELRQHLGDALNRPELLKTYWNELPAACDSTLHSGLYHFLAPDRLAELRTAAPESLLEAYRLQGRDFLCQQLKKHADDRDAKAFAAAVLAQCRLLDYLERMDQRLGRTKQSSFRRHFTDLVRGTCQFEWSESEANQTSEDAVTALGNLVAVFQPSVEERIRFFLELIDGLSVEGKATLMRIAGQLSARDPAEANWHEHVLNHCSQGNDYESKLTDLACRWVIRAPQFASTFGSASGEAPSEFQRYLHQKAGGNLLQQVVERLIQEIVVAKAPWEKLSELVTPGKPLCEHLIPILKTLRYRESKVSLLEQLGAGLKTALETPKGGRRELCAALDAVGKALVCDKLPAALDRPLKDVFADDGALLHRFLKEKRPDPDETFFDVYNATLFGIAPAIAKAAEWLFQHQRRTMETYLNRLGMTLLEDEHAEHRRSVYAQIAKIARPVRDPTNVVWDRVFYAMQGNPLKMSARYVEAGECLLVDDFRYVEPLLLLFTDRSPRDERSQSYGPLASLTLEGWAYVVEAMAEVPDLLEKRSPTSEEVERAIRLRVDLASRLLVGLDVGHQKTDRKRRLEALAYVAFQLGALSNDEWYAPRTATAVACYLTLDGVDPPQVRGRAKDIYDGAFCKALPKRLKNSRQAFCQALSDALQKCGVDLATADDVAGKLENKLLGFWRFIPFHRQIFP